MADRGAAALSLLEALIEQLKEDGTLSPESVDAIYDGALARVLANSRKNEAPADGSAALLARLHGDGEHAGGGAADQKLGQPASVGSAPMRRPDPFVVVAPGGALPYEAPTQLKELVAWWERRAMPGLPDRRVLDEEDIAGDLLNRTLLEVHGAEFEFHVVGDGLRARYGALCGRQLGAVLTGRAREEIVREHRLCAAERRPTLMRRSRPALDGSDVHRYWRLLLPFGHAGETVRLLSIMHFDCYH